MNALRDFLRTSSQAVASWWQADRIRVSPFEGRLLKLAVGDQLHLADQIFTVVECESTADQGETRVRYQLTCAQGCAELIVRASENGVEDAALDYDGRTIAVQNSDLTILPATGP